MSDEVLKVVVVCITLVVIAIVGLVGYVISLKTNYEYNRDLKIMRQGLERMQKQCNDMYARYEELNQCKVK